MLISRLWYTAAVALGASVRINFNADWPESPFALQLIEAVSSYNESLYVLAVRALSLNSEENSDWDEDEEDAFDAAEEVENDAGNKKSAFTDKELYHAVVAKLLPVEKGMADINLVNKIHTPRIEANYRHYDREVKPLLEEKVLKQCKQDSFGNAIADPLGSWVKHGDKIYCSEADLYALQITKKSEKVEPFDRIVGNAKGKPLLVLYGSPASPRLAQMFETLYQLAESGNFRFSWRYTPLGSEGLTKIPGYGAIMTPKNPLNGTQVSKIRYKGDLIKYLTEIKKEAQPLRALDEESYYDLSAKITALVLEQPEHERNAILSEILNNLPLYGPYLQLIKDPANIEAVRSQAKQNEKKGASKESIGLYLNGASVHNLEQDLPHILNKLKTEVGLVKKMQSLGFTAEQAKFIFSKYALMSAFREVQYRTGEHENRYAVYKQEFDPNNPFSGGVVYFNDLEKDDPYDLFDTNRREAYLGAEARRLQFGQLPALRENAHEIVFAINFSSKIQVKVFFTFAKIILDQNLPQQIAIVALVDSEEDKLITEKFYHIMEVSDSKEAFALLYQYYEAETEDDKREVLEKVELPETKNGAHQNHRKTIRDLSLDQPSVIINGVIHNMKSPWQAAMTKQLGNDVRLLQQKIRNGEDNGKQLKSVLFHDAKEKRNSRVSPKDLSNIRYKEISEEMIEKSYTFRKVTKPNDSPMTFWLIGDFDSRIILSQFAKLLALLEVYDERSVEIRIFSTSKWSPLLEELNKKYGGRLLTPTQIESLRTEVKKAKSNELSDILLAKAKILEIHHIQVHQPGMLINSRYLKLNEIFEVSELAELINFEQKRRLSIFKDLTDAYPDMFLWHGLMHFKKRGHDDFQWFDLVSSIVARSFFLEDSQILGDVDRFDFSALDFTNSYNVTNRVDALVDVLAIVDPLMDVSQKTIAIVDALKDLPFVNARVLVQPLDSIPDYPTLKRFYALGYVASIPEFDEDGSFLVHKGIPTFDGLSTLTKYISDLDAPSRWSFVKDSVGLADHDDFDSNSADALGYKLDSLVIEGHAKDVKTAHSVATLTFEATNDVNTSEAIVMHTLGYLQILLKPDVWSLGIQKGSRGAQIYSLLSASNNKYDVNDRPQRSVDLCVFSLHGDIIHPRLQERNEKINEKEVVKLPTADINVFSIASGKLYERFMATMMMSVKQNTKSSVKFWLLRNFLSAEFVEMLPKLAKAQNFEYEFVSYKWPVWLRQETEKHRQAWGFKILFLDVLFPNNLDKVIFVDADQTARADLKQLVDTDLHGRVYGFPPMCDSREEVEGYRFWKQGYWKNVLQDDLKYHISALFVVDLARFRAEYAGDRLRTHYQKLSSDKGSLSNLDQDLPNNMQRLIPIHTLDQDWLWCETWCSDESKKSAKMIDLCSDPTKKESKLERVQRLIPEWKRYDEEVQRLQKSELKSDTAHDEL